MQHACTFIVNVSHPFFGATGKIPSIFHPRSLFLLMCACPAQASSFTATHCQPVDMRTNCASDFTGVEEDGHLVALVKRAWLAIAWSALHLHNALFAYSESQAAVAKPRQDIFTLLRAYMYMYSPEHPNTSDRPPLVSHHQLRHATTR